MLRALWMATLCFSFHLLCYTQGHKFTWPDGKNPLSCMWRATLKNYIQHIHCLLFQDCSSVRSVSHIAEWGCINVKFWLCGLSPGLLSPLRTFRNLKWPSPKLFAVVAWLKRQKVFKEFQSEYFSLWYAVRASCSLSDSLFVSVIIKVNPRFYPLV